MPSRTILTEVDGWTPIIDALVDQFGLITAAVFGVAWRYCQMEDGVCRASLETIGNRIGLDKSTVMRHFATLVEHGYLKDLTPEARNRPHVYADTGKASLHSSIKAGVAQGNTSAQPVKSVAYSNAGVAASNRGMAESNTGVAENQLKIHLRDSSRNKKEKDYWQSTLDILVKSNGLVSKSWLQAAFEGTRCLNQDGNVLVVGCKSAQQRDLLTGRCQSLVRQTLIGLTNAEVVDVRFEVVNMPESS